MTSGHSVIPIAFENIRNVNRKKESAQKHLLVRPFVTYILTLTCEPLGTHTHRIRDARADIVPVFVSNKSNSGWGG